MTKSKTKLEEDLEFALGTERAWKRYDLGKFKSMPLEKFLKWLKKL